MKLLKRHLAISAFLIVMLTLTPLFCLAEPADPPVLTDTTSSGSQPNEPQIDIKELSQGAVIYCVESKSTLISHNADVLCDPLASTKIMTALTAFELIDDIDKTVEISSDMLEGTSGHIYGFEAKMNVSYRDIFKTLLLRNANDAALILSRSLCQSDADFILLMNQKAEELNMSATVYDNVTGFEGQSKTTLDDSIKLLLALLENDTLLEISGMGYTKLASTGVTIYSRNFFLSSYYNGGQSYIDKRVLGGISGASSSGLDSLWTIAQKDGLTYLVAVDKASRSNDSVYSYIVTGELLKKSSDFDYVTLLESSKLICTLPVTMGKLFDELPVFPAQAVRIYTEKGLDTKSRVSYDYDLFEKELEAPVSYGDKVGVLTLCLDGEIVCVVDLVAKNDIPRSSSDELYAQLSGFIKSKLFIRTVIIILSVCVVYVLLTAVKRGIKRKNDQRKEKM